MADTPSKLQQVVQRMIDIRDKRAALKKQFEEADQELKAQFARGDAWLLAKLEDTGANSLKCTAGTVFIKEDMRASAGDWDALAQHVLDTGEVELLERRVSKTAVKEYMERTGGELPPGVMIRTERTVNIRRA